MTRVLPRFPIAVRGINALSATTQNGVLEVGIDPTNLAQSADPTAPGNYTFILKSTTNEFELAEVASTIVDIATKEEAEAGTDNTAILTPLRAAQEIAANVFPTRAELLTRNLPAVQTRVRTSGRDVVGVGAGIYREVVGPPSSAGWTQPDGRSFDLILDLPDLHQFGVKGDGTDEAVAANAAITFANGREVEVPRGEFNAGAALGDGARPTILRGRGEASLLRRLPSGSVGPHYALRGSDVHAERLAIMLDPDPAATSSLNLLSGSTPFTLDRVRADGGVVLDVDGVRNSNNNIMLVSTGADLDGITIRDSHFTRFMWGFLQANDKVRRFKNMRIQNNLTDAFAGTQWLFNAPAVGAGYQRLLVTGNFMGSVLSQQPFGKPSGYPHRSSFAGVDVRDFIFAHNFGYGYGGELVRVEEGRYGLLVDSVASELGGTDGVEIIPNNVSGTMNVPEGLIVSRLILRNSGLVSSPNLGYGIGIHVYTSQGGAFVTADAARASIISNNYMAGWLWGYSIHQGTSTLRIADNIADSNQFGFRTFAPSVAHSGWMLVDNTKTGIFERGGTMGDIHVASKTGRPGPIDVNVVAGPGSFSGWSWTSAAETLVAGNNDIPIAELGRAISMDVQVDLAKDGVHHCTERGTLIWTGTKAVYHRKMRDMVGGLSFSGFGTDGGNLVLRAFNGIGGNMTAVRIQVWTRGIHKIGV